MAAPIETAVRVTGPAGELELRYLEPDSEARGIAVICHPHPQHGGTMDNKVVYTLSRTLLAQGLVTLRFNFRGVGHSQGKFDHGLGERADLAAVVAYARQQWPQLQKLWLAGFSFGAFVSALAANELEAEQLISIAPPVKRFDFSTLSPPRCRWLIVMGDADEVVEPQAVFDWVEQLQPRPQLIRMTGAGHYFHGRLPELRDKIEAALRP